MAELDGPESNAGGSDVPAPEWDLPKDLAAKDYFEEIKCQTDRGLAVLMTGFLEYRVRRAIKQAMNVWDKHAESIFGTDSSPGELSFKYQCRMAYGMGLIGPVTLADLDRVGRIRNKFAHRPTVKSFDHEAVRDLCDELEILGAWDKWWHSKHVREHTRRENFRQSAELLSNMLFAAYIAFSQQTTRANPGRQNIFL